MELPFFEVLDENNIILFDLSKTDQGEYEILFYEGCSSRSIKIELFNKMIHEAKNRFLEEEE